MTRSMWLMVLWACVLAFQSTSVDASSYFVFDLVDTEEEDVVSRSVNSDIFLHFEILEPLATDAIDVRLTSPSGRDVQAWPLSKGNHSSILVRESGLYTVCFTKTASSSRRLSILYAFDHASIGSRTLTRLPASTSTIVRAKPDETSYTELNLETSANYPSIVYSVQVLNGSARLTGNAHAFVAHYPVITFEDIGLDVMREIGHFRYAVWDLKGELISIIQNERHSRNSKS
ncbi:hypothetical protein B5M09_008790 [Aphanomyces astaci]|uniref:GOLD domain-containing protein n=1 Tax=Aphanomyces astaci TaxID=112090 RepID=A0A425CXN6_APHAT|nr:hypothetical protein B5M09_008790 [Aphanomyces astaci]